MRILIIGKNSFIGNNFIKFHSHSHEIKEFDTLKNDINALDLYNVDTIIHLAAIVHQTTSISEDVYFKVNRDLAVEVAQKAKKEGVRQFVFMSTAKVFGESTTHKEPWNEYSECKPQDAYGKSKLEAEKILLSLQNESFIVSIIRSPLVYGPGVKANMYNLIKLIDKVPVLPFNKINNRRSFVYVGNLVSLINHVIETRSSGIFIAGDRIALSLTDLSKYIIQNLGEKRLLFSIPSFSLKLLKTLKPNIFERLFGSLELDNSHTNKKLNFVPPFSSNDGIKEMVNWYKDSNLKS